MFKVLFAASALLAVFSVSIATVPPAGKCKNVTPTPLDVNKLALKFKYWKTRYVPDHEAFSDYDGDIKEVFSTADNMVIGIITITTKDNTTSSYENKLTYGYDLILYEEAVETNGEKSYFRWYPLTITNNNSALYYRCSDNGSLDTDTRFIINPLESIFSDLDEIQLLNADNSLQMQGGIRKLDYALV